MKLFIVALGILCVVGCSRHERAAEKKEVSITLLDGLTSSDPSEQEASLSKAKITPYGAILSVDELLSLSAIFQQLV
jgi:uncharacterized protein YcfL